MLKLRRQLINYVLPSEAKDVLGNLVGDEIVNIMTGILTPSVKDFREKETLISEHDLFKVPHGGPFFLKMKSGRTLVFNYDSFLNSIVLRDIKLDCEGKHFLENFYKQDSYVPDFLRAKSIVSSKEVEKYLGCIIENISIYKYPDNYKGKPIGHDNVNEVAVCVSCADNKEFLVMSGLGGDYTTVAAAIITWKDVAAESLEGLEKVWIAR